MQPSLDLCVPSTSTKVVVGNSRNYGRPRVVCAAQRGQSANQPNHVVKKATASRAGLQRSQAVATPVREEVSKTFNRPMFGSILP